MKKIILIILTIFIAFACFGCENPEDKKPTTKFDLKITFLTVAMARIGLTTLLLVLKQNTT